MCFANSAAHSMPECLDFSKQLQASKQVVHVDKVAHVGLHHPHCSHDSLVNLLSLPVIFVDLSKCHRYWRLSMLLPSTQN